MTPSDNDPAVSDPAVSGPAVGGLPDARLHRLVEAQVAVRPTASAVSYGSWTLSYAELNARANGLADDLVRAGVRTDELVAICLPRGAELAVAALGVLKAGGGYLPLDLDHPVARLRQLAEDAAPRFAVCCAGTVGLARSLGMSPVQVDRPASRRQDNLGGTGADTSLAYAIYTSGSTGQPKAVLVEHRNVVRLLRSCASVLRTAPGAVWTVTHSFAFDFSVWELWGCLASGGHAVVVPTEVARVAPDLLALLARENVAVLSQTPSAFRALATAVEDADLAPADLPVRRVVLGGEALHVPELAEWFRRFGDDRPALVNMYGITETTVHVTHRRITAADVTGPDSSPIGTALPGWTLHVRGADGRPVAAGGSGELWVGGAGVARGYLNRPELTAERFRTGAGRADRLYRTGDLVKVLANGELAYLGRIDRQVKVRGYRVELGEVEAALGRHPEVRSAYVEAVPDPQVPGEQSLVAWVHPPAAAEASRLRAFLADTLPGYAVPATYVPLATVPLTVNGKVDRSALPAPEPWRPAPGTATGAAPQPARTPAERVLAEIWARCLGLADIGRHDSFFDLGGDSLKAVRVASQARHRGLLVDVGDILRHQTLDAVAAAARWAAAGPEPTPGPFELLPAAARDAVPDGVSAAYPLTRLQQGMLAEQARATYSQPFHIVVGYRVRGLTSRSAAALREAVAEVASRHELLRTSFTLRGFDGPVQLVHDRPEVPVEIVDLRGKPGRERSRAVAARTDDEWHRPLPGGSGPLWRLCVLWYDDECDLLLSHHHAILDGWSVALLLAELRAVLTGTPPVPVVPPPYRAYVAAELAAAASTASRDFWRDRLARFHAAEVRSDRQPAQAPPPAATVDFRHLRPGVLDVSRTAGVPVKTVLLAAHLLSLYDLAGDSWLYTGLVTNGRLSRPDADRALGLFLNTVPFGVEPTDESQVELVRRVLAAEQEIHPHRRFPLAMMRAPGARTAPPITTVFNFVSFTGAGVPYFLAEVQERGYSENALSIHLLDWALIVDGNPALVDDDTCADFADRYLAALGRLVEAPGARVSTLAQPAVPPSIVAMPDASTTPGAPYEAPRTDDEARLAQVWCAVLEVDQVGRCDSFFRLGGDSIDAVRATSQVCAVFNADVPVSVMFDAPDLAGTARNIRQILDAG